MTRYPQGLPFRFETPIGFWMEKSAPGGQQKRFGGIITTETRDRQGEVLLTKGLDLEPFLANGWYNDNHTKDTDGIVGFPDADSLKRFQKGDNLPNGKPAHANGIWAEGYMLDNERGLKIWDTAMSLQKAGGGRSLGFSVEGGIQKRVGKDRKTVAKATVRNVAITNCPVNIDTHMDTLAKSLAAVEQAESPDELWKALGMGTAEGGPLTQPAGPQSGETAGQVLAPESLEDEERVTNEAKKSFTHAESIEYVMGRMPNLSLAQAGRIVDIALKRRES